MMFTSEDAQQEYECLLLEGVPHEEALALAKQQEPQAFQYRGVPGSHRPVAYVPDEKVQHVSVSEDCRSDAERDLTWAFQEAARQRVEEALSWLPARQATYLRERFGLDDGTPKSMRQAAEALGLSERTLIDGCHKALKTARHLAENPDQRPKPVSQETEARRRRDREYQRKRRERLSELRKANA